METVKSVSWDMTLPEMVRRASADTPELRSEARRRENVQRRKRGMPYRM